MNYINPNINILNISKNNKRIKPQKNKNNFNKSSKTRKNEIKTKLNTNYTSKNSKILYTNSNNVIYNSIDFPSTTTSTNRTNNQLYLPYKDGVKSTIIKNKGNNKNKKINLGLSNSNKILSFSGIATKNMQNTSRKKLQHNIELILNNNSIKKNLRKDNNGSEKKVNKNIYLNEKIMEKNNKIDKLKKDLVLSEMILNNLKHKNMRLMTVDNSNKHIWNNTYDKYNSHSLKTENFNKNKKMLTLNLNDNFFNKKGNSYTNISTLLTFNYINKNFLYKKNYYKSLSPQNKPFKNNFFSPKKNKNNLINKQSLPLTHTQKNLERDKIKQFFESDFNEFKEKCEEMKIRTRNILTNYIKLSESLQNLINNK